MKAPSSPRSGDALAPAGTTALVSLAAIGSFALQTWIKSPLIFGGANSGASPGRRGLASAPKSPVMQGMSSPRVLHFSAELQQYLSNDVLITYIRYFGGFYDTAASSLTITPPLLGQGGNKSVQQVPATLQSLAPSSSSLAAAMPLGSLSTDATPRSGSAGSSSSPVASSSSVASISWIHNLLVEGVDGAIEHTA